MAEVVSFPDRIRDDVAETVTGVPNDYLIAKLEELLRLAKDGDIISGAFVCVYASYHTVGDCVMETEEGQAGTYHLLNSGAARLAQRLATYDDD